MKLLFIHDHPFYQESDLVYSGGSFPSSIWNNYLSNFDSLSVYGRASCSLKNKIVLSSSEHVQFYLTNLYSSPIKVILNLSKIRKELQGLINDADVVLVRLPSILGIIAAEVAYKQAKPLWVEQVGNAREALSNHSSLLGKFTAPILEKLNLVAVKKANFVSYVTKNKLQNDYPCSSTCISTSLSDVLIHNKISSHEFSELFSARFRSDVFNIGVIGGFDAKYKGQDILLKAIVNLPLEIKEKISIYFIGKGDYSWLLALAIKLGLEENIKFIGSLSPGKEVNDMLKKLSLYIQPSLTEGMPRAILEAMAMGCPVIGSNVGEIPEVVSSNLIHSKLDYIGLSNNIRNLYLNRDLLEKEAFRSLKQIEPYLRNVLEQKRAEFYKNMNVYLGKYN